MITEKEMYDSNNYRKIKPPFKSTLEYYEQYYKRNQSKFMRRSKLEISHLGEQFEFDGKTLKLIGAADPKLMVVVDINDDQHYFLHSDVVTEKILNKEQ